MSHQSIVELNCRGKSTLLHPVTFEMTLLVTYFLSDSAGPSGRHQRQSGAGVAARGRLAAAGRADAVHSERLGRDLAQQLQPVARAEVRGREHLPQLLVLLLLQDHPEHDLRRLPPGRKGLLSGEEQRLLEVNESSSSSSSSGRPLN